MEPAPGHGPERLESLQELIQRRRVELGLLKEKVEVLTLEELAARTSTATGDAVMSAQRWGYWARTTEKVTPKPDIIENIAAALAVSTDEVWAAAGVSAGMITRTRDVGDGDVKTRAMAMLFAEQTPDGQDMLLAMIDGLDRARRALRASDTSAQDIRGSS